MVMAVVLPSPGIPPTWMPVAPAPVPARNWAVYPDAAAPPEVVMFPSALDVPQVAVQFMTTLLQADRKSTRLNSSH